MTCPGPNARLAGGQIVSRVLKENGINTVFSLAGTTHTNVLDPLDQDGFTIFPGRSENGTVGADDRSRCAASFHISGRAPLRYRAEVPVLKLAFY